MNKKWVCIKENEDYRLIFTPFDDDITVAKVYHDCDGDWTMVSELLGKVHEYFEESEISVDEMKEIVEEMVSEHYKDEAKYYQSLAELFEAES